MVDRGTTGETAISRSVQLKMSQMFSRVLSGFGAPVVKEVRVSIRTAEAMILARRDTILS